MIHSGFYNLFVQVTVLLGMLKQNLEEERVVTAESQFSGLFMDWGEIVAIFQNPLPDFAVQTRL